MATEIEGYPRLTDKGQALVYAWVRDHARNEEAEIEAIESWYEKAEQAAANASPGDSVVSIEMSAHDASRRYTECLSIPWEFFEA